MVRVKVNILHGNTNTVQFKMTGAELKGLWVIEQHKGLTDAPCLSYYLCLSHSCTNWPVHVGEQETGDREKEEGLRGQTGEIKARTLSLLLWPAGSGSWQLKKQPLATSPSRHTSTSRRPHMIYSSHLPSWKMTLQHWINPAYSRVQGTGAHFIPLSLSSTYNQKGTVSLLSSLWVKCSHWKLDINLPRLKDK